MQRFALRVTVGLFLASTACKPAAISTPPSDALLPTGLPAEFRHEIPFKNVFGLIVLPVHLDGLARPLFFVLDSGAPTVLRKSTAAELGLLTDDTLSGADAHGGSITVTPLLLPGLSVGDLHMTNVAAVATELPEFATLCHPIDGLLGVGIDLGSGFLDRLAVEIDYARERLILADAGSDLTPGGLTLPLRRSHINEDGEEAVITASQVNIRIEDQFGWVTFDTGNSGEVQINRGLFERLGRSLDEPGIVRRHGILGESAAGTYEGIDYETRLHLIGLGDQQFTEIPATVVDNTDTKFHELLLGYELLHHFTVIVDYPADQVRLIPRPDADPSHSVPELGFAWDEHDGKVQVTMMLSGGPAEQAGLALGDELLQLAGVPLKPGDHTGQCEARKQVFHITDGPISVQYNHHGKVLQTTLHKRPTLQTP